MSAFLCTAATFDAIASYAAAQRIEIRVQTGTAAHAAAVERFGIPQYEASFGAITYRDLIARELHRENVRSINARYPDPSADATYTPRRVARDLTHAQVLGALRCYNYQACESRDWVESLASAICDVIERHAIREMADTEGTWPVEEELVRPAGVAVPISLFELAATTARSNLAASRRRKL